MKKLIKSLPALGLVLAAAMAFAFNMPQPGTLKGQVSEEEWVIIQPGDPYDCDDSSNICTARFDENDNMLPGTETEGVFIPL